MKEPSQTEIGVYQKTPRRQGEKTSLKIAK
jgi:hypothetical protein